jgi:hypothetical protein
VSEFLTLRPFAGRGESSPCFFGGSHGGRLMIDMMQAPLMGAHHGPHST